MSPVPHYAPEPAELIIEDKDKKNKIGSQDTIHHKTKEPYKEFEKESDDNIHNDLVVSTCQQNIQNIPSNVSITVSRDDDLNGMDLCEELDCKMECDSEKNQSESYNVVSDVVMNGEKTQSEKECIESASNGDRSPNELVQSESNLPRDTSMDTLGEATVSSNLANIAQMDAEACGCPLKVFYDVSNSVIFSLINDLKCKYIFEEARPECEMFKFLYQVLKQLKLQWGSTRSEYVSFFSWYNKDIISLKVKNFK